MNEPNNNPEVVDRWVESLTAERLLMGKKDAVRAQLTSWFELYQLALSGDAAAEHELYKQIAFHAKALGLEGRPASAAVMQMRLLEDRLPATTPEERHLMREMLRVSADAHALGASDRLKESHHQELRNGCPVFRLDAKTVVGFMIGAMSSDLIDALVGRVLRESVRISAEAAVIDVFGAAQDDDRFHRTILAVLERPEAKKLSVVLVGLRNNQDTREALKRLGADLSRVQFFDSLSDYIEQTKVD